MTPKEMIRAHPDGSPAHCDICEEEHYKDKENSSIMKKLLKVSFQVMVIFWVLSPALFCAAVLAGRLNFNCDWLIASILAMISFAVMFLTYKNWE